jgi:hypothetical protein
LIILATFSDYFRSNSTSGQNKKHNILFDKAEDSEDPGVVDDENLFELVDIKGKETYQDVQISPDLTNDQKHQVRSCLRSTKTYSQKLPGLFTRKSTRSS